MVGVAVIVLTNHNIRKEKTALSYEVEVADTIDRFYPLDATCACRMISFKDCELRYSETKRGERIANVKVLLRFELKTARLVSVA